MRVLIVEDEPSISLNLQEMAIDLGCQPFAASTMKEALEVLSESQVDIAVLDLGLPDGDGFEIAKRLLSLDIPYVIATASTVEQGVHEPQLQILAKPFDSKALEIALQALMAKAALKNEHVQLRAPEQPGV